MTEKVEGKSTTKTLKAFDVAFWVIIISLFLSIIFFKYAYIRSGSMEPTLKVGAIVVVNPYTSIQEGDIAMYKIGSSNIVHRVVSIDGDNYIFKGDNVPQPDLQPIPKDKVVGKVVFKTNALAPILGNVVKAE